MMLADFLYGVLMLGVWLQSYGAIPLQTTTQQRQKRKLDCFPSGFDFAYDDVIDEGNFPDDRCWEIKCGTNGRLIKSITKCKRPKTSPPTTRPTNTDTTECIFESKKFKPGDDIQSISDKQTNRCYGTRCNKHGQIVAWENFNCFTRAAIDYSTTDGEESVQTTPSSVYSEGASSTQMMDASTTPNAGCFENSVIYQPGEEISYQYFSDNQTCCGKYCNFNNKVITWQKERCHDDVTSTYEPSTTTQTFLESESTTEDRPGCLVDGHTYQPNSDIDSGNDGSSWCFGRYCNEHSVVTYWDNFHCDVTNTSSITTPRSGDFMPETTLTPSDVGEVRSEITTESYEDNRTEVLNDEQKDDEFDIFQQLQRLWWNSGT